MSVSSSDNRRLKLEQNHNTWKNIKCQVRYVDGSESHSRVDAISLSISLFVCMLACMHVCQCVCALLRRKEKACLWWSAQTWELSTAVHWAPAVSYFPHMPSHPIFSLSRYSCITPFMDPTLSALLYFHASCDEALLVAHAAFCNWLLNNWPVWEAVERRPLLEVNITASQGW